jgi:hypothetical protein
MVLLVVLLQVIVGDRVLLPVLMGTWLKLMTVMLVELVLRLLVIVGKGWLVVVILVVAVVLQLPMMVGGHMLMLVGKELRMLILVLVPLLGCGAI